MKKYIYYHIYLPEDTGSWYFLFLDQIFTVINSGLYEEIEKMYVVCIGTKEQIEMFHGICNSFNKVEILGKYVLNKDGTKEDLSFQRASDINYSTNNVLDEVQTLKRLEEHAHREDAYFLYLHSKAITSPWRMKEEKIYQPFVNTYLWRKFLEWGCVEQWKICTDNLENHGCAGVNFCSWPVPHYSGNFWWSKSSYIKTLPSIVDNYWWDIMRTTTPLSTFDSNRNKPEMWIANSYNDNFYNILSSPAMPPETTLTWRFYPRSEYEKVIK